MRFAVGVSGVHGYPSRPEGFEEPLFPTLASKRAAMEHLSEAPWLMRACELGEKAGEAAHALREPIELRRSPGRMGLVRPYGRRRCSWRRRRVLEILDRWRETGRWWDEDRHTDRSIFRVLLSGEIDDDLVRERSGRWLLVGVVD